MTTLVNNSITIAQSGLAGTALQIRSGQMPRNVTIQANFIYGSGSGTCQHYVQTSIDGSNWIDVINFTFTTVSARSVVNLSALTPVTTPYTPTDGSFAANTVKDGIIGPYWRGKTTSAGTYAATTLLIDVAAGGQQLSPPTPFA